jgi:hypothetical protein
LGDSWKVHALPLETSEPPETPRRYRVVLEHPDARGLGWKRQIRGIAESGQEEQLGQDEARAIARALNAMTRKMERANV